MNKTKRILVLLHVGGMIASQGLGQEVAFRKAKQVIQEGDKTKQRDVALIFQDEKLLEAVSKPCTSH